MITNRLMDEAFLVEQIAGEITDTEQRVRLSMMANRLRNYVDDLAQMPVFVPPPRLVHSVTVIPFPRFCDVTPTPPEAVA